MTRERRADYAFITAIAIGVLFIVFLGPLARRLEMVHNNDFSGIWSGPAAILVGVDPWDPARYAPTAVALGTKTPDALVDDYMPWEVIALLPLGLLPLEAAAWVWMIASMAFAALALRALLRTYLPGRPAIHFGIGLALFVGQPGFHALVLGQWALLLMAAVAALVLALRAGHVRRAALASLAFLAKPQLFVWSALGFAIPAVFDQRYRRFVRYALVIAGALVVCSWLAYPDWLSAWLADIPPRRTGRSAVMLSALGQLFGTPGRVLGVLLILAALAYASRFEPGSDAWLAMWLALSNTGAIYSWSYDQVLLFVPLTIACGVLVSAGRERAATRLALGGAATLLLISPIFYFLIAIPRHDETFSALVPFGFFIALAWVLWPYRAGALLRQHPAQQVQPT